MVARRPSASHGLVCEDVGVTSAAPVPGGAGSVVDLGHDVYQVDTFMAGYSGITAGYLIRSHSRSATSLDPAASGDSSSTPQPVVGSDDRRLALLRLLLPDLSIAHGRFLYFMPDEVEPCQPGDAP